MYSVCTPYVLRPHFSSNKPDPFNTPRSMYQGVELVGSKSDWWKGLAIIKLRQAGEDDLLAVSCSYISTVVGLSVRRSWSLVRCLVSIIDSASRRRSGGPPVLAQATHPSTVRVKIVRSQLFCWPNASSLVPERGGHPLRKLQEPRVISPV